MEKTKEQIEKELLEGIEQTGIKSIPRELLDGMDVSYLVLTSQLLGLRQGYELGLKKKDVRKSSSKRGNHNQNGKNNKNI